MACQPASNLQVVVAMLSLLLGACETYIPPITDFPTRDGSASVDAGSSTDGSRAPDASPGDPPSRLLLHSTFESPEAILAPEVYASRYTTTSDAAPGLDFVTFEPGRWGQCARLDPRGFEEVYDWPVDGPIRFEGANFDFADPANDGGRLDLWVRFDVDPLATTANTWMARTNWNDPELDNGDRLVNFELAGNAGDTAKLMVDVYSSRPQDRSNYGFFRVSPRDSEVYTDIRQGEWHVLTLTWRRNGGPDKAELHLYIDGTQAGCRECNDYNGNLPDVGAITDFILSPELDGYMLFSVDEIYSFDGWNVDSADERIVRLERPLGVTITYPEDGRGPDAGVWGNPVPASSQPVVFEFFALDEIDHPLECALYVDGDFVSTVMTRTDVHTEIASTRPLSVGAHSVEIACDSVPPGVPTRFCYGGPCDLE